MPGAATYTVTEELITSRFGVDISGLLVAAFTECSGLSGEIEVETYQEGGLNDYEHKLAGRTKYGNVTLKNGVATAINLWKWFSDVATGKIERREISIIMYSQSMEEQLRWNLTGAFPVRWQGPEFSASDSNVAVHSLELAHHGITLSQR